MDVVNIKILTIDFHSRHIDCVFNNIFILVCLTFGHNTDCWTENAGISGISGIR